MAWGNYIGPHHTKRESINIHLWVLLNNNLTDTNHKTTESLNFSTLKMKSLNAGRVQSLEGQWA